MSDETPAHEPEVCEVCLLRSGTRRVDPYILEIAHRRVERIMCEVCYTRSCQDI